MRRKITPIWAATAGLLLAASPWSATTVHAVDISLVQPAALDQPRVHAYLALSPGGEPLAFEGTFNIEAFFDTGASGILLSNETADALGILRSTATNPQSGQTETVVFHDVGVGGTAEFNVSQPLHIALAPYHPEADIDNINTYTTVYNQTFGPVRTQIGPVNVANPDPNLEGLDVFGVPLMQNKVVVMDPKPVNSFLDTMRTYVYNPGTPYNAAAPDSDPGIPATSRHIKLSYANFAPYTTTTPSGAAGPDMSLNPFIGPNPLRAPGTPDTTPGITVSYNGTTLPQSSWLLDTGAAASMISKGQAALLGVTYDPATIGTDHPTLLGVPEEDQFILPIGGIGGTANIAGFYLDTLLVRTQEGNAANDADPAHLRYLRAPVLVHDVGVADPITGAPKILDGIFGMNFLVASAAITMSDPWPIIDALSSGPFSWMVYDQQAGTLGLEIDTTLTQKADLIWAPFLGVTTWAAPPYSLFPVFGNIETEELQNYKDGDHVTFDDSGEEGAVDIFLAVAPESILVDNTLLDYTFSSQTDGYITGPGSLTKRGAASLTIETANDYTGPTEIVEGAVTFVAPQRIGEVNVRAGGSAFFQATSHLTDLHVDGGAVTVEAGGDKVLVVETVAVASGRLNLKDNDMIVKKGTLADVRAAIRAGYHGGAWDGQGIVTDVTVPRKYVGLGYARGNDPNLHLSGNQLGGESFDANAVLVKFTYYGDADLDGDADGNDIGTWALNFTGELGNPASPSKFWTNGDWDYDGDVDGNDAGSWALNFTGELGGGGLAIDIAGASPEAVSMLESMGISVVPEPGAMGLIGLACLSLARRRSRGRYPR